MGTDMSTKERILTIRLMEKLREHPAYAGIFGIEAMLTKPKKAANRKEKQK